MSHRKSNIRRQMAMGILLAFFVNSVLGPVRPAFAQAALPLPTSMVTLSSGYAPTLIKGMRVYPENPLRFDFIVDPGDSGLQGQDFQDESSKLMKYFLSSLTVPEKDLWVNLSPYEKDRIIPDAFGKTEMGRDMLGQDYILKQLTASLIYPESELGKSFWTMAYQKAYEAFGSTDVDVNTFNKIWIVPEKAVVFAKNNIAYVTETHLKVMLEEDYVASREAESLATARDVAPQSKDTNSVASQVVRQIILPAIEKEVNEGQNFAPLRQVYNSLILATWFKRNLKQSILEKVYVGQNKIDGVTFNDATNKEKIYADYLSAFKKGVYNYIKEEEDRYTNEMVPRKYFSGGVSANEVGNVLQVTTSESAVGSSAVREQAALFAIELGRPTAAVQVNAGARASSSIFSLLRDNRASGSKQEIWSGRFTKAGSGTLTMPDITIEMVDQLKQAAVGTAQSEDTATALQNLRPLADYFLAKFSKEQQLNFSERVDLVRRAALIREELAPVEQLEQSVAQAKAKADQLLAEYNNDRTAEKQKAFVAAEMAYSYSQDLLVELSLRTKARQLRKTLAQMAPQLQRANFMSKMPLFLNGVLRSDADMKELLATITGLVNDLPSSEVAPLLQLAKLRAQTMMAFFSKVKQDALNMDGLRVAFVLNAPEVFALTTTSGGEKVLEVDLMSFMKKPNKAQVAAWRYDFLNILDPKGRVDAIKKFSTMMGSDFIDKNAETVKEVLRILIFMKYVVDPYFQTGPVTVAGTEEEVEQAKESFFNDLAADGHYAQLIPLLRELGEKINSYPGKNGKNEKLPAVAERIEVVLRHILNNPNLAATANVQGNYTSKDITLLAELYLDAGNSQWFSGAFIVTKEPAEIVAEDFLEQDPEIAALQADSVNVLDSRGRVAAITKFSSTMKNDFIKNNAAAIEKVLRILVFMRDIVDPYFQIGPALISGTDEEVAQARQGFFDDLSADSAYAPVIPLLRELSGEIKTYPDKDGKNVNIPVMSERVETVLSYIQGHSNFEGGVKIEGNYQSIDIILMTELYLNAVNSQWYAGSWPKQDAALASMLTEKVDVVADKDAPEVLPAWAQRTLESAPGELYDESNPVGWEQETLGDVAWQWVMRQFSKAADAVSARINIKQWALSGAIAVAGLFTIGNFGQGDLEAASEAQLAKAADIAVAQRIESDEAWKKSLPQVKAGDTGQIISLMKNLKDLKKLQQGVQGEKTIAAEQAAQLDSAVEPPAKYTVKLNDTLGDIALKFGKNSVSGALEIASANPEKIENMHLIFPGQLLEIPGTTTVTLTLGTNDTSMKKVIEKIYGTATSVNLKKFLEENPGIKSNSDLRPGATVTAILPVDQAKKINQSESASVESKVSSVTSLKPDNVGGINLDPSGLEITTGGQNFKFDAPIDPQILQNLQQEPVNGFVPVILNVVPIINLPQFLGIQKSAEPKDSLAFVK